MLKDIIENFGSETLISKVVLESLSYDNLLKRQIRTVYCQKIKVVQASLKNCSQAGFVQIDEDHMASHELMMSSGDL